MNLVLLLTLCTAFGLFAKDGAQRCNRNTNEGSQCGNRNTNGGSQCCNRNTNGGSQCCNRNTNGAAQCQTNCANDTAKSYMRSEAKQRLHMFHPIRNELDCPDATTRFLEPKDVPLGKFNRAYRTIPDYLYLDKSSIPGAGDGIFARTFIPSYTWLGEYEGDIEPADSPGSYYAWFVNYGGKLSHIINLEYEESANWLRWVNCARTPREHNVRPIQCRGRLFQINFAPLYPGQEVLAYYGHHYAKSLGVDTFLFDDPEAKPRPKPYVLMAQPPPVTKIVKNARIKKDSLNE